MHLYGAFEFICDRRAQMMLGERKRRWATR
jgi:hypothetical protein